MRSKNVDLISWEVLNQLHKKGMLHQIRLGDFNFIVVGDQLVYPLSPSINPDTNESIAQMKENGFTFSDRRTATVRDFK